MPLPKINTPIYELELPSTKKKIRYRPFLEGRKDSNHCDGIGRSETNYDCHQNCNR